MRLLCSAIATGCCLWAPAAGAQLRLPPLSHAEGYTLAANGTDATPSMTPPADAAAPADRRMPEQLWWRNAWLITGGVLAVGAYGAIKWWDDGFTQDFRTEKEGWFGQDTKNGGADKLGHAFFSYGGTRLLTAGFQAAGNDAALARQLGFWTALGIMTGVEVLDGYSKQFHFSGEDAVMNVAGAGLGYLMERNADLDRLVDFRLYYRRSDGASWEPAGDYSGQTYLLVGKASGVPALRGSGVLRYLELAVGYGTRGYQSTVPGTEHQRNLYYGISLNLAEVLNRTVFRDATEKSGWQRGSELFLELIQVPGTVALARHQL